MRVRYRRSASGNAWAYSFAPPISISSSTPCSRAQASARAMASSSEANTSAPSRRRSVWRLTTIFSRPGSGRPRESQVLRPMMIGLPRVMALKCLRSAGRCQGIWLSRPITRLRARAAIMARGSRVLFMGARITPECLLCEQNPGRVILSSVFAASAAVSAFPLSRLDRLWLCEAIRLREEQAGPLEDGEANRRARLAGPALEQRIEQRALLLAERDGQLSALRHWNQGARLALLVLALFALLSGAGLAFAALGD